MMKDAKTYREYAADCRRMAKLTSSKDKEVLMKWLKPGKSVPKKPSARRVKNDAVRQQNRPSGPGEKKSARIKQAAN